MTPETIVKVIVELAGVAVLVITTIVGRSYIQGAMRQELTSFKEATAMNFANMKEQFGDVKGSVADVLARVSEAEGDIKVLMDRTDAERG